MDKLTVIRMALLKCGLPLPDSLADCDFNASLIYDNVVKTVFRAHPWGFATVFTTLPAVAKTPAHGFERAYALPDDCLRFIDVRSSAQIRAPRAQSVLSGRHVYTNANPCHCRYVRLVEDPADWPPDFTDAVACFLAAQIAALSAEKSSLVAPLLNFYQLALTQAQTADARENSERVDLPSSIYEARGLGGQG